MKETLNETTGKQAQETTQTANKLIYIYKYKERSPNIPGQLHFFLVGDFWFSLFNWAFSGPGHYELAPRKLYKIMQIVFLRFILPKWISTVMIFHIKVIGATTTIYTLPIIWLATWRKPIIIFRRFFKVPLLWVSTSSILKLQVKKFRAGAES